MIENDLLWAAFRTFIHVWLTKKIDVGQVRGSGFVERQSAGDLILRLATFNESIQFARV